MSGEYRCWSKNPFVTRNNGMSDWRIFENFPYNVKVWYNIVIDIVQEESFSFCEEALM